jgi:hypothetical protein
VMLSDPRYCHCRCNVHTPAARDNLIDALAPATTGTETTGICAEWPCTDLKLGSATVFFLTYSWRHDGDTENAYHA